MYITTFIEILYIEKLRGKVFNTEVKCIEMPCIGTLCTVKCNTIPLQALTGPEGSSKLRLPDFKTIST
jgi:hypothetical protein